MPVAVSSKKTAFNIKSTVSNFKNYKQLDLSSSKYDKRYRKKNVVRNQQFTPRDNVVLLDALIGKHVVGYVLRCDNKEVICYTSVIGSDSMSCVKR